MFIHEYLVDLNGTRAAIAVGVSENSAAVTASRWLKDPKVAAAIAQKQARLMADLDVSAAAVMRVLGKIMHADVGKLYDDEGNRIPVHKLDEVTRAAIGSVEDETTEGAPFVTTRKQRVKMLDKVRAAELLGKRHGLFGGDATFSAAVETPNGLPPDSTIKIVLVRPDAD